MVDGQISNRFPVQLTSLATYDYTDLAEGVGYVIYYLFESASGDGGVDGNSTDYDQDLGTQQLFSKRIESELTSTNSTGYGGGDAEDQTINFDLAPFNLPRKVKGTFLLSLPMYAIGAGSNRYAIKAEVFNSTTSTSLGSEWGTTTNFGSGGAYKYELIKVALTETHFRKGDVLRIALTIRVGGNTGDTKTISIGIDPQNRDGAVITPSTDATTTTTSQAYVPFKITD